MFPVLCWMKGRQKQKEWSCTLPLMANHTGEGTQGQVSFSHDWMSLAQRCESFCSQRGFWSPEWLNMWISEISLLYTFLMGWYSFVLNRQETLFFGFFSCQETMTRPTQASSAAGIKVVLYQKTAWSQNFTWRCLLFWESQRSFLSLWDQEGVFHPVGGRVWLRGFLASAVVLG